MWRSLLISVRIILYHVTVGHVTVKGHWHAIYFQMYCACISAFSRVFSKDCTWHSSYSEKLSQGMNFQLQSKYQQYQLHWTVFVMPSVWELDPWAEVGKLHLAFWVDIFLMPEKEDREFYAVESVFFLTNKKSQIMKCAFNS